MSKQATINVFPQTNLRNESEEYLVKRDELRMAELELMRQREHVAELRRQLPQGATIQDYAFEEGPANLSAGDSPSRTVRIGELFTSPNRPLVVYHFMFGKKQARPCPMCTMFIDGWNGVAHHLAQNVDMVIVAAAKLTDLREYARTRVWDNLRLLSCGDNTFKYDMSSEDREGQQDSMISVFIKDSDGKVRHSYSAHPRMAQDVKERGLDLLCPVYNVLDLTPPGRGNWVASLSYPVKMYAAKK